MKKIYYFLLLLLMLICVAVVYILVNRADQADKFFEYQRIKQEKNYE